MYKVHVFAFSRVFFFVPQKCFYIFFEGASGRLALSHAVGEESGKESLPLSLSLGEVMLRLKQMQQGEKLRSAWSVNPSVHVSQL